MKEKVLVTGSDGFIGSHLVEKLVIDGYSVKAFVLYNSFNSWGWLDHISKNIAENIEVISGDIRDPYSVKNALKDCNIVLHLAALIAIPYSYNSPYSYVDTNIKGTLNVLQASRELNIEKMVHTSTSEIYGTAQFIPMTEEHPVVGQSPYAASKIAADQLAMSYYYSFKTPVAIIRPFNTFGPRQSARAVIPTIIIQLLSGKRKIKLGSITPTRNFNYINDTVNGFSAFITSDKCIGKIINIGNQFEVSIGEIANLIAEIMNVTIEIETDDDRVRPSNSEVKRLSADNSKAIELLEWQPFYADKNGLIKGLEKTIEWFSKNDNIKAYKSDIYNI